MQSSIASKFEKLKVWSASGTRAPHKPLLVLLALGFFTQGKEVLRFVEVEKVLADLLREFGPSRQSLHPEYPFWRLQNDGVWKVETTRPLARRQSNSDPLKSELRAVNAEGHFTSDIIKSFHRDRSGILDVARELLTAHFPITLHEDILNAVGLSIDDQPSTHLIRDRTFRSKVLTAYRFRCAVCGMDLRIGNVTIAIEAAHIMWHQAGGPSMESNGIALCSLHHKLFDLGAIAISPDYQVLVSDLVHGGEGFEETLMRHHGARIETPMHREHRPSADFLGWHRKEVFKGVPRPPTALAD